MSGWIEWSGGQRPVSPMEWVEVKFHKSPHEKDNMVSQKVRAKNIMWENVSTSDGSPSWGNVVAYRAIKINAED